MAIESSCYDLFRGNNIFQQIQLLDNFYELIDIEVETGTDLNFFLTTVLTQSNNVFIKRSAFKILAEITLLDKIRNIYSVLNFADEFLNGSDVILQTIALKYLFHFDAILSTTTIERIISLSDSSDGDVASQAYYLLGIRRLGSQISTNNVQLVLDLNEALRYFDAAVESSENREDAKFFIVFIQWLLSILANNSVDSNDQFIKLEESLQRNILYSGEEIDWVLEYLLYKQVTILKKIVETTKGVNVWLDIKANVELLMKLQAGRADQLNEDHINVDLLGRINNKLLESVEDATFKLHLTKEIDRLAALNQLNIEDDLSAFIEYLLGILPDSDVSRSENYAMLALLSEFAGSDQGLKLYNQIQRKELSVENAIKTLLNKAKGSQLPFKTGSIQGEEVLLSIMKDIDNALPNYPEHKRQAFMNVLEEIIRYARTTFVNSDKSRYKYLFSDSEGGKGQSAIEQDLQDDLILYFEHSKIADGLEHEKAKFVDGGRVDILYKKDIITIPMELKRTQTKPNKVSVEQNYIAQAQTYTSGYDQLGIFILLELSDKSKDPPPNFKDWFDIHHLAPSTELLVKYPDYVISVVIPGNRTLPSSKSTYR